MFKSVSARLRRASQLSGSCARRAEKHSIALSGFLAALYSVPNCSRTISSAGSLRQQILHLGNRLVKPAGAGQQGRADRARPTPGRA